MKPDFAANIPIYLQIIDTIKKNIAKGKWLPGEKLPSVRELSKTITVNPNTVQKAYRELERQGYVYTTSGVGTFVADRDEIRADDRELEAAKGAFDEAFRESLLLGLSYEQAKATAMEILEERRTSND